MISREVQKRMIVRGSEKEMIAKEILRRMVAREVWSRMIFIYVKWSQSGCRREEWLPRTPEKFDCHRRPEKDDCQRRPEKDDCQRSPGRDEFRGSHEGRCPNDCHTAAWERMDIRVSAKTEAKFSVHDWGIQPYATVGYIPQSGTKNLAIECHISLPGLQEYIVLVLIY